MASDAFAGLNNITNISGVWPATYNFGGQAWYLAHP